MPNKIDLTYLLGSNYIWKIMRIWNKLYAPRSENFWAEDRFINPQRQDDAPLKYIRRADGTVADFNLCTSKCQVFIGSTKTYNQWINPSIGNGLRYFRSQHKNKFKVRNCASTCNNNAVKAHKIFSTKLYTQLSIFPLFLPPLTPFLNDGLSCSSIYCHSLQTACLFTQKCRPMVF